MNIHPQKLLRCLLSLPSFTLFSLIILFVPITPVFASADRPQSAVSTDTIVKKMVIDEAPLSRLAEGRLRDRPLATKEIDVSITPSAPAQAEYVVLDHQLIGDGYVRLMWETAAEHNNGGFRVLQSESGDYISAVQIGYVASKFGAGTGPGGDYAFDQSLSRPGDYFFWIMDIDTNGYETLFGPIQVTMPKNEEAYLRLLIGS